MPKTIDDVCDQLERMGQMMAVQFDHIEHRIDGISSVVPAEAEEEVPHEAQQDAEGRIDEILSPPEVRPNGMHVRQAAHDRIMDEAAALIEFEAPLAAFEATMSKADEELAAAIAPIDEKRRKADEERCRRAEEFRAPFVAIRDAAIDATGPIEAEIEQDLRDELSRISIRYAVLRGHLSTINVALMDPEKDYVLPKEIGAAVQESSPVMKAVKSVAESAARARHAERMSHEVHEPRRLAMKALSDAVDQDSARMMEEGSATFAKAAAEMRPHYERYSQTLIEALRVFHAAIQPPNGGVLGTPTFANPQPVPVADGPVTSNPASQGTIDPSGSGSSE